VAPNKILRVDVVTAGITDERLAVQIGERVGLGREI